MAEAGRNHIWQDKDIKFDLQKSLMEQTTGEHAYWSQQHIEDAKGNEGDSGTLTITNMRIIWYQTSDPKINLSIGLGTLVSVDLKNTYSQTAGNSQTLHIKSRFKQSRFEFIFKSMLGDAPKIFKVFNSVFNSYENSKMYRELKMKGGDIIKNKDLLLLPLENIKSKYQGVCAVGADKDQRGIMYFTNVRIVWFSITNESFNMTIPWIQIKSIAKKSLKSAGPSLIISTYASPCGYQFEQDNLENVLQESQKLLQFYLENPELGVTNDDAPQMSKKDIEKAQAPKYIEEEIQFVDSGFNERSNITRAYQTNFNENNSNNGEIEEIVYAPEFGIAIEKPPQGQSLEDLWRIIKINK